MGAMTTPSTVRPASMADIDAIGSALGAAFEADPVLNWLVRQDERREWAIEAVMKGMSQFRYVPHGASFMADDGAGAAVWMPPGIPDDGEFPELDDIFVEAAGPRGMDNFGIFAEGMEGKHPADPHYYLFAIGVRPETQSQGLGARLLAPILERADAERMPCYLESTNIKNHTFYFRHGFQITERIDFPDGPSIWLMWRDAV